MIAVVLATLAFFGLALLLGATVYESVDKHYRDFVWAKKASVWKT
jgi:hypothetical protein